MRLTHILPFLLEQFALEGAGVALEYADNESLIAVDEVHRTNMGIGSKLRKAAETLTTNAAAIR